MKSASSLLILLTTVSLCYAGDNQSGYGGYGTVIAIEVRAHGEFNGVVGRLEYTETTLDLVTFLLAPRVIVGTQVYEILEKTITSEAVHHIKGRNQYEAVASGSIDLRDRSNPRITLVGQGGHVFTNMSMQAKEMKAKYIPQIDLGL